MYRVRYGGQSDTWRRDGFGTEVSGRTSGEVVVTVDESLTLAKIKQEWPPAVDVTVAALAFGLSRSHAYELISRGEFPAKVIKVGSRYRVITESVIQALSADQE